MIDKNHSKLSIRKQCELLSVSRTGLYYSFVSEKKENLEMMKLLDKQYFETPFYGVRKMTIWLQNQGFLVNKKRVRRLMKLMNWRTIYQEPKTTIPHPEHQKYPYLLKDLKITHKNQVWATDITYIPMNKGFMYLIAVIDLHSRCVLNWSLSNTMTADWCAKVVQETIEIHGKPLIFNTDQGSQFTSNIFINTLKNNEIQISMDGKGRAIDNIFIERLWRTVKYEHIYLYVYESAVDLENGLDRYFRFYNQERFHQSLDYKTPESVYKNVA